MTLLLTPAKDHRQMGCARYEVRCGGAEVGNITTRQNNANVWYWSITRHYLPRHVASCHGSTDSLEKAMAAFAAAFRAWLSWHGLRELEEGEMVPSEWKKPD